MKRAFAYVSKDPVLMIAAALALLSMLLVPPSPQYLTYIDFKTLMCLFCLMTSMKGLEREGALAKLSLILSARIKNTRLLAAFFVFLCFFSAMLVTNDVALIAIMPVSLALLRVSGLKEHCAFIVVLQTIAANIGSSLTPIGNPQNLYLFTRYQIPLSTFFATMLPIVAVGGVLLAACCLFVPANKLQLVPLPRLRPLRSRYMKGYSLLFLLSVAAVFDALRYEMVFLIVLLAVLLLDTDTLKGVDYSLLLTFLAIFLFVGNLGSIKAVHTFLSSVTQRSTFLTAILTSQVASNVPTAILLSGFTDNARALLAGVNIGGMGTLIASMASVISYKLYAREHKGQAGRYLRLFTVWNVLFLAVLALVGWWAVR